MRRFSLFILALVTSFAATAASAAVTVYPVSVFDESGPVTGSGAALGAPDGGGTLIGTGGSLTLEFDEWLVGDTVALTLLPSGFVAFGAISIGHVVSGVAVFSTETAFTSVFGSSSVFDLSGECAAISASGCSLVRIRTTGAVFSPGLSLDGVTSSAPEPGAWVLMIVGFALLAARLKWLRRKNASFMLRSNSFAEPTLTKMNAI